MRLVPIEHPAEAPLVSAWRATAQGQPLFLSAHWLAAMAATRPSGCIIQSLCDGDTPLAYLGQRTVHRHGLLRARQWVLNETGDTQFDRVALEYNGLLGTGGGRSNAAAAFRWLMHHKPGVDEIIVRNATAETASAARAAAARCGWQVRTTNCAPAALIELNTLRAAGGDVVATAGRNTRAAIRRSFRLYQDSGPICVDRAASVSDALEWFAQMQKLHIAAWQQRGVAHAFANPYFANFHQALIRESFSEGRVDLLRVRAGEREIGYLYNFVSDGWVMAYQSGLTPAPDNRWKPGLVCHCAAVDYCLNRGDHRYDFLAGPARYKMSLANSTIPMESLIAFAPRWHLTVEDHLRRWRAGWRDRWASRAQP